MPYLFYKKPLANPFSISRQTGLLNIIQFVITPRCSANRTLVYAMMRFDVQPREETKFQFSFYWKKPLFQSASPWDFKGMSTETQTLISTFKCVIICKMQEKHLTGYTCSENNEMWVQVAL